MAYKVNDARNRSETYREGGKVEVKKYEEGKKPKKSSFSILDMDF